MTKTPLLAVVLVLLLTGCTASPHSDTAFDDPRVIEAVDGAWYVYSFMNPGVDRPEVEVEKLMWGFEEQNPQLLECLHDEGFPETKLSADGTTLSVEDGDEVDGQTYALALYICKARYPLDPEYGHHPPPVEGE
jgi:hypothetical protein